MDNHVISPWDLTSNFPQFHNQLTNPSFTCFENKLVMAKLFFPSFYTHEREKAFNFATRIIFTFTSVVLIIHHALFERCVPFCFSLQFL